MSLPKTTKYPTHLSCLFNLKADTLKSYFYENLKYHPSSKITNLYIYTKGKIEDVTYIFQVKWVTDHIKKVEK